MPEDARVWQATLASTALNAGVVPDKYAFTLEMQSSRESKQDLSALGVQEALKTLAQLNPVKYRYRGEETFRPNLGFVAEEMPDNLASVDRRSLAPFEKFQ